MSNHLWPPVAGERVANEWVFLAARLDRLPPNMGSHSYSTLSATWWNVHALDWIFSRDEDSGASAMQAAEQSGLLVWTR